MKLVELPLESMSLFKGHGQRLRTPTNHRLGRLQVLLQRPNLSAQLWKKDDKLRSRLKEKTKTSKAERIPTKVGVLKDGESLLLPSHLLAQLGVQLLSPKHLAQEREHFLVDLRPGLSLRL